MEAKIQTATSIATHSQPYVKNANELKEQAERAIINDEESFANATDFVRVCQTQLASLEEGRKAITGPLNNHVKWINGQFKPIRETIEAAKKTVSDRAAAWKRAEDERIRQEQEEARRKAEEEALKAAEEAAESGDEERAERILDVASTTPVATPAAPPVRGSLTGATGGTRETWKGEVEFDKIRDVCRAIAAGQLPTNIIKDWHKTNLNAIAKEVGKDWPKKQDTGSHLGLTITRVTGLNVR